MSSADNELLIGHNYHLMLKQGKRFTLIKMAVKDANVSLFLTSKVDSIMI